MVLIDLQNHTATFCPPLQGAKVANLSPLIRLTLQAYSEAPTPPSITPVHAHPDPLIVSLYPPHRLTLWPISTSGCHHARYPSPVFFLLCVSLSPLSFSFLCFTLLYFTFVTHLPTLPYHTLLYSTLPHQ